MIMKIRFIFVEQFLASTYDASVSEPMMMHEETKGGGNPMDEYKKMWMICYSCDHFGGIR